MLVVLRLGGLGEWRIVLAHLAKYAIERQLT